MLLAPMDGYTDIALRIMCQKQKAEYCYTELISPIGYSRGAEAVLKKAHVPKEDKSGLQFCGSDADSFHAAVFHMRKRLEAGETFPKSLDLNMGCPVENVMKTGSGAALMKRPETIGKILKEMDKAGLPLSVKMRLGLKTADDWKKIMPILNKHDLQHVTIHLRTQQEMYSGNAHWDMLPDFISKCKHPVIANGNATSKEDAERLKEMGAQNVMIGRAALTNPYIFKGGQNSLEKAEKFVAGYEKMAKKYKCEDKTQTLRIKLKLFTGFEGAKEKRKEIGAGL